MTLKKPFLPLTFYEISLEIRHEFCLERHCLHSWVYSKPVTFPGSLSFLTQPLGGVLSGPLVDNLGRKKATFLVNLPHFAAWILMFYSWNLPSLFMANALIGFGTGLMEAPINSYVGEIS